MTRLLTGASSKKYFFDKVNFWLKLKNFAESGTLLLISGNRSKIFINRSLFLT